METHKKDIIPNALDVFLTDTNLFSEKFEKFQLSQRLLCALYLVTDLMDEEEPLKRHLRNSALDITNSVSDTMSGKEHPLSLFSLLIARAVSLLEVARIGGLMSDMNYRVLERGYVRLRTELVATGTLPEQGLVSDDFFVLPVRPRTVESRKGGRRRLGPRAEPPAAETSSAISENSEDKGHIEPAVSDARQSQVLARMATGELYSIKDIAASMPNCGEKTVQRALGALILRGLVERVGKRRWSRYRRTAPSA